MTFTIKDAKEVYVRVCTDVSGNFKPVGSFITDSPTTYKFSGDNFLLRLIDTPGLGDTRGIEFDRRACNQIMHHVSTFRVLHGIIILLKPDVTTLSAQLRYCLIDILSNMHRSVTDNVLFGFSRARSCAFGADDETSIVLDVLLQQCRPVCIDKFNTFYVDSEPVRYLAAEQSGYVLRAEGRQLADESYHKSISQIQRLFEHIPPHPTSSSKINYLCCSYEAPDS